MTDHLPECPLLEPCSADIPQHGLCPRQNTICIHCERQCFCERLLACERRVLDDAREAVAALDAYYAIEECQGNPLRKGDPEDPDPWHQGHLIERDNALAAIDALREEKPPPLSPSVGVPSKPMWPLREEQK